MRKPATLKRLRRLSQLLFTLFFFSMPIFDILRYDVNTRDLYLFGNVWTLDIDGAIGMEHGMAGHVAWHILLKALLPWVLVLSIFPLMGLFTGRLFCGWLCPEGALFELAEFFSLKIFGRRHFFKSSANDPVNAKDMPFLYAVIALVCIVTIPVLTAVMLTGFFIAPADIWQQLRTFNIGFGLKAGIIGVCIYMFITSVLVRHVFCRYVCAAGLMQMLFGWFSPFSLKLKYDRVNSSKCTDCRQCEKVCFMDIKPRLPRYDISCVNCGECVDACNKELGSGHGLFSLKFGVDKSGTRRTSPPSLNN
ncbi:4Fe-4S binding protein [Candidatus Magnetominusculus xianensis]|uniref:(Fe-S)-binding protein n=1 Tax=Candidatus Magnetominusculus xianensis TaxID=1748249 RepID=A0ABR5SJ61_9BACT|nr:4Fe-4S binding protein [Candidatus Magnetominusculus xianensis]KWT91862.1 (Fe-S)-binding protein [Candidatus Magnetominusculus xianensis]MBF0404054.1 4Fe-4S binding protein [Nitrospirota bacterium]